jgi:hypothetical protein
MAMSNDTLTGVGAGMSASAMVLGQVSNVGEAVGVTGGVIALLILSVRVAGESWKGWLAYKEAALHAGELKADIARLEADADARKRMAKLGVCPFTEDGAPACKARPSDMAAGGS